MEDILITAGAVLALGVVGLQIWNRAMSRIVIRLDHMDRLLSSIEAYTRPQQPELTYNQPKVVEPSSDLQWGSAPEHRAFDQTLEKFNLTPCKKQGTLPPRSGRKST